MKSGEPPVENNLSNFLKDLSGSIDVILTSRQENTIKDEFKNFMIDTIFKNYEQLRVLIIMIIKNYKGILENVEAFRSPKINSRSFSRFRKFYY